jgi:hypothetical protein
VGHHRHLRVIGGRRRHQTARRRQTARAAAARLRAVATAAAVVAAAAITSVAATEVKLVVWVAGANDGYIRVFDRYHGEACDYWRQHWQPFGAQSFGG